MQCPTQTSILCANSTDTQGNVLPTEAPNAMIRSKPCRNAASRFKELTLMRSFVLDLAGFVVYRTQQRNSRWEALHWSICDSQHHSHSISRCQSLTCEPCGRLHQKQTFLHLANSSPLWSHTAFHSALSRVQIASRSAIRFPCAKHIYFHLRWRSACTHFRGGECTHLRNHSRQSSRKLLQSSSESRTRLASDL